jgi:hypothetical protein
MEGTVNERWQMCIKGLLDKQGLSTRAAAKFVNFDVSAASIRDWAYDGRLPSQDKAMKFLKHFDRDVAIECLKAGNFEIPEGWLTPDQSVNEAVELAMRVSGKFEDITDERRSTIKQEIITFIEKMKQKYEK